MANEKIRMLYGPKERIPKVSEGADGAGRLFFTVITSDGIGSPEGHIYYDNGEEIVHLYKTDIDSLETKIKAVEAVVAELTGDEIDESIADMIQNAIEEAVKNLNLESLGKPYEFGSLLPGAYVTENGKEYRVCFKSDSAWKKQNNDGSNPNYDATKYYMSMKAYAPNSDVAGFKESAGKDKEITDPKLYHFIAEDFGGIDADGRKYSIIWLPVAENKGDSWNYFGNQSSNEKSVGWYYTVEWYDVNNNVVDSDQIRISLINEDVKPTLLPSYMGDYAKKEDIKGIGTTEWGSF